MTEVEPEMSDFEDEEEENEPNAAVTTKIVAEDYIAINRLDYKDFKLKPELLRAVLDNGFENPLAIQNECIPRAMLGIDVLCQAQSGAGKTSLFVIATLQQLDPIDGQVSVLVLCHRRELAFQISEKYKNLSRYMTGIKVHVFSNAVNISKDEKILRTKCPHILIATPERILALVKSSKFSLQQLKIIVVDECDKIFEVLDMRRDLQEIFYRISEELQVMIFTATLTKKMHAVCKKFMRKNRYTIMANNRANIEVKKKETPYTLAALSKAGQDETLQDIAEMVRDHTYTHSKAHRERIMCISYKETSERLQKAVELKDYISAFAHKDVKEDNVSRNISSELTSTLCDELYTSIRLLKKTKSSHKLGETESSDIYQKINLLEDLLERYEEENNDYILEAHDKVILSALNMNIDARESDLKVHSQQVCMKKNLKEEKTTCWQWFLKKLHLA